MKKKNYHKSINNKEINIFRLAMVHDALEKGITNTNNIADIGKLLNYLH